MYSMQSSTNRDAGSLEQASHAGRARRRSLVPGPLPVGLVVESGGRWALHLRTAAGLGAR